MPVLLSTLDGFVSLSVSNLQRAFRRASEIFYHEYCR